MMQLISVGFFLRLWEFLHQNIEKGKDCSFIETFKINSNSFDSRNSWF